MDCDESSASVTLLASGLNALLFEYGQLLEKFNNANIEVCLHFRYISES